MARPVHTPRPELAGRPALPLSTSFLPRTVLLWIGGASTAVVLVLGPGLAADQGLRTAPVPSHAAQGPEERVSAQEDPVLAELGWIAGTWREERANGEILEERWDPPLGNSMTGTMRWLRGDKAAMYEFLLLEETADGVRLHVRHFGPGAIAHEEKDKPLILELDELGESEAVFTAERDFPRRYELHRGPDGHLRVVLEGEREGQPLRMEFDYTPAGR